MAKHTVRDALWTFAIKRCFRSGGTITAGELSKMADASKQSARDCLITMSEKEILRPKAGGEEKRYIAALEIDEKVQ